MTNEPVMTRVIKSPRLQNATILILFILIFAAFSLAAPSGTFLTRSNLESIGLDAAQLLIIGAGITFLLISAGLDLSVGAIVVFSSVTAATIMSNATQSLVGAERSGVALWAPVLGGALAGILVGMLWGLFNGLVVVRTKIPPFIATLASSTVILGLAQVWTGGINVSGAPSELQTVFGLGRLLGLVPWPIVVAILVVVILWVVLAKTRYGLRLYAIGANPEAARRAGISVDRYTVSAYVLVGGLAGMAGTIDVSRFTTATVSGYSELALDLITAVVIGGTSLWGGRGGMGGTIVGALIPSTLRSGFVILGLQPFWQNVAVGLVLMLAVTVDQYRRRKLSVG